MQQRAEIPSELVSLIYAAATDNSLWQSVCDELYKHTKSPVKMFGHSVRTYESLGLIGAGWDPAELDSYHRYYGDLNPWMQMDVAMPVGMVGVSDQAVSREDLFKTEFYNDWLRPQEDLIAGSAMICYRSNDKFVAMVGACRARDVDNTLPDMTGLLETLSSHITQSITISTVLQNGNNGSMQHLQTSRYGIMLVHHSGRIGFVNATAEHFLSASSVACITPTGKLRTKDEKLQGYFSRAVRAMQNADYNGLPKPFPIPTLRRGRGVIHSHIFPDLAKHDFPGSVWSDPVAGAFVIAGRLGLSPSQSYVDMIASFGATPAEARIAQALMEGNSLYEFADANHLSRHTVRNQMRALLHKTGTRNQADFINLMHSVSSPFEPCDG